MPTHTDQPKAAYPHLHINTRKAIYDHLLSVGIIRNATTTTEAKASCVLFDQKVRIENSAFPSSVQPDAYYRNFFAWLASGANTERLFNINDHCRAMSAYTKEQAGKAMRGLYAQPDKQTQPTKPMPEPPATTVPTVAGGEWDGCRKVNLPKARIEDGIRLILHLQHAKAPKGSIGEGLTGKGFLAKTLRDYQYTLHTMNQKQTT